MQRTELWVTPAQKPMSFFPKVVLVPGSSSDNAIVQPREAAVKPATLPPPPGQACWVWSTISYMTIPPARKFGRSQAPAAQDWGCVQGKQDCIGLGRDWTVSSVRWDLHGASNKLSTHTPGWSDIRVGSSHLNIPCQHSLHGHVKEDAREQVGEHRS